jgi:hypothetical protein
MGHRKSGLLMDDLIPEEDWRVQLVSRCVLTLCASSLASTSACLFAQLALWIPRTASGVRTVSWREWRLTTRLPPQALSRLTKRELYDRAYRLRIAHQCAVLHRDLPRHQQTTPAQVCLLFAEWIARADAPRRTPTTSFRTSRTSCASSRSGALDLRPAMPIAC